MKKTPINNGILQSDLDVAGFDLLNFSGGGGGSGLPDGGTAGQLLQKQSSTDFDADWATITGGGGGGGGGIPLTFVNVKDAPYGAAADGVTDDTDAINTAMADVVASGGGTVFFPKGTYLVNGPFHPYWKSILAIPSINNATDSMVTLELLGENMPGWSVVGAPFDLNNASTIKTTRTDGMTADPTGFAAIIAGMSPLGNGIHVTYADFSGVMVKIKNLNFLCPSDPTMGGIRLDGVGMAFVENCVVYAGGAEPTHGTTGVWMPNAINWSISWMNHVVSGSGFDTGFKVGEHLRAPMIQAWACKTGIAFLESMYPSWANIQFGNCVDAVKFLGYHTVDLLMETEHAGGGSGWLTASHDISDPSNYGTGIIKCYVGHGTASLPTVAPAVDGGTGLTIIDLCGGSIQLNTTQGASGGAGRLKGRIYASDIVVGYTDTGLTRSGTSELKVTDGAAGTGTITGKGTVPTGGATGQVLAKATATNYDVAWTSVAGGVGGTSVTSAEVQVASAAATSADVHANAVSTRVVSVSSELVSLLASVEHRLSSRIDLGGGTASVTSAELQVASAAATSADAHANAVSVRVVSVSAELASLLASTSAALATRLNTVSAVSGAGDVQGLQSVVNKLSANIQVASAAATSADTHANTVSVRAVSISAELVSLLASTSTALAARDNTISAAAAAADTHANTVSIAAAAADTHANTVSVRVVSVSAELASLLASTSAALETHINLVSAAGVTGGASVTSNELASLVQIASLAATSADGHANAVSIRAVSISNELGSLLASASTALAARDNTISAVAAAADTHANTVSVRAVSISAELASLVQIASLAATSADGHANTVSIRAVSISNELGSLLASASTALAARDNTISAAAAAADTHANTVSVRAVSISAELASLVQIASAAALSADTHANTVSVRVVSVSAELVSLMNSADTALSLRVTSVAGAAGGGSITSAEFFSNLQGYSTFAASTVSVLLSAGSPPEEFITGTAAQPILMPDVTTLVLGKQYLIKNNSTGTAVVNSSGGNTIVSIGSGKAAVLTCILTTGTTAASWDYTMGGDAAVDAVSARVVSVSAELASLLASTSAALETHVNTVSGAANTVSARVASVSAELVSLIVSATPKRAVNTAAQASITVSTGLTVSGVSVALVAGQTYSFQFQIPFTCLLGSGIVVAVTGPATNTFACRYEIPGASVVSAPALLPAANAVIPLVANVRAIGTKVSSASITLTGTTLMAFAEGFINPSANGSIKFVIGPNTSGGTNSGVIPLLGCNVVVMRLA